MENPAARKSRRSATQHIVDNDIITQFHDCSQKTLLCVEAPHPSKHKSCSFYYTSLGNLEDECDDDNDYDDDDDGDNLVKMMTMTMMIPMPMVGLTPSILLSTTIDHPRPALYKST